MFKFKKEMKIRKHEIDELASEKKMSEFDMELDDLNSKFLIGNEELINQFKKIQGLTV